LTEAINPANLLLRPVLDLLPLPVCLCSVFERSDLVRKHEAMNRAGTLGGWSWPGDSQGKGPLFPGEIVFLMSRAYVESVPVLLGCVFGTLGFLMPTFSCCFGRDGCSQDLAGFLQGCCYLLI
jgi:hypothetical protein